MTLSDTSVLSLERIEGRLLTIVGIVLRLIDDGAGEGRVSDLGRGKEAKETAYNTLRESSSSLKEYLTSLVTELAVVGLRLST